MEIPPNILKELEERKLRELTRINADYTQTNAEEEKPVTPVSAPSAPSLAAATEAPEKMNLHAPISPISPVLPLSTPLLEAEPHKPAGIELFFDFLSRISVHLAIFLTPLFFFNSSDVINLPKQFLLSALAMLAVIGWSGKVISAGNIVWRKSAILWPALLVALSAIFSSAFSSSFWVSFLGDSGRYAFSGASILSYIIISVVAMQALNRRDFKFAAGLWLVSVFLTALFGLLQLFGKFILPWAMYSSRAFNTVGSTPALALYVLSSVPFLTVIFQSAKNWRAKSVVVVMAAVQTAVALVLDFRMAWIALAAAGIVLVLINFRKHSSLSDPSESNSRGEYQKNIVIPLFLVVAAVALWLIPVPAPRGISVPPEISPSYGASLDIMAETLKNQPVFGSGLETFPYVYARFKNASLNQTNFWGVNFNDSTSEILTLGATSGIFGLMAWLAFAFVFLSYAYRAQINADLAGARGLSSVGGESSGGGTGATWKTGLFASWVFILVSKFLYPTPLALELAFWILPALFVVAQINADQARINADNSSASIRDNVWRYYFQAGSVKTLAMFFVLTVVLLGTLVGAYFSVKRWRAEKTYARAAVVENNVEGRDTILDGIARAIALNPYEARYFRSLSQVMFQKMGDVVSEIQKRSGAERQAKPEETTLLQNLTVQTINSVERARRLDPQNVAVLVESAEAYKNLAGLVQGSEELAIQNYERATEMEPINPFIKTQLGQLYLVKSNLFDYSGAAAVDADLAAKAKTVFEEALKLNPNYANARYFWALIKDKEGEKPLALENFRYLKATNPENKLILQIVQNLENGFPALGVPPAAATPPQAPSAAPAKGLPVK